MDGLAARVNKPYAEPIDHEAWGRDAPAPALSHCLHLLDEEAVRRPVEQVGSLTMQPGELHDFLSTLDLGDVPTWLGAVGAVSAVGWAVFLYRGSLKDRRVAQARLLSVVGGAAPVQATAGSKVGPPPVVLEGVGVHMVSTPGEGQSLVLSEEAFWARVHLVSTSGEAFSDLSATLLLDDAREVIFPLSVTELAPHATLEQRAYYKPGVLGGSMRVRVRFKTHRGGRGRGVSDGLCKWRVSYLKEIDYGHDQAEEERRARAGV